MVRIKGGATCRRLQPKLFSAGVVMVVHRGVCERVRLWCWLISLQRGCALKAAFVLEGYFLEVVQSLCAHSSPRLPLLFICGHAVCLKRCRLFLL